ncbi:MAG: glycosyltransferase, partial [Ginsengibacter sp.]
VDNNSTDNTMRVIDEYKNKYPDLIRVFCEKRKGAPCARNKGVAESKGEWIQFLDSDDEILPQKLKHQMDLVATSRYDVIVSNSYIYRYSNDQRLSKTVRTSDENVWKGLLISKLGITSANLWRKEAVQLVSGWDENKNSSQEYDLLFRMLQNNISIGFCHEILTIVHINPNSISNSRNDNRIVEILQNSINLRLSVKKYLQSKNKLTKELNQAADMHIYNSLIAYSSMITIFFKKGIIPDYVRKTLRENSLSLPPSFLIKLFIKRTFTRIKGLFG